MKDTHPAKGRVDVLRAVLTLARNDIMAEERGTDMWEVDGYRRELTEAQVVALADGL